MSVSGTRPREVRVWKGHPRDRWQGSLLCTGGRLPTRGDISLKRDFRGAWSCSGVEFGGERKPTPSSVSRGLRCERWGDKQCNLLQINPRGSKRGHSFPGHSASGFI